MSAPVVTVTQADRDAAEAYWDSASDDWNPWSDISEDERALTVQAFARHRLATEAAFRAREAQLVEALQDLADALEDRTDFASHHEDEALNRAYKLITRAKATREGADHA